MVQFVTVALILHIEDDPKSRLLVKKLLQAAGHSVVDAESGLEGIRLAGGERPDIVLVDINVPDLDGYEVTLRLRGMPSMAGVPIVAITAEGDRMTSLAVGADGFIAKPIDAGRFAQLVERYLRGHREHADETGEIRLRERSQKIVERLEKKVQRAHRGQPPARGAVAAAPRVLAQPEPRAGDADDAGGRLPAALARRRARPAHRHAEEVPRLGGAAPRSACAR